MRDQARWAGRADLKPLIVARPGNGRLVLGKAGRHLIAAERSHSVLVVGPTQSRKTTGFAIPAILEWEGPLVATSVKADLVRDSYSHREQMGSVWVYDPTESVVLPNLKRARWSPVDAAVDWGAARRVASSLTDVARLSSGSLTDGDFWYSAAAKLLGPMLLAASIGGLGVTDLIGWLDTQEVEEVEDILRDSRQMVALRAAHAGWGRDERQRSAVFATAEIVLEAFADPNVGAWAEPSSPSSSGSAAKRSAAMSVDPTALLDGQNTLFVCAPAHQQRRLRPVFATLVAQVVEAALERANHLGGKLDHPLLVVLDEAANVAPLADLDSLASVAAGHGIQLVTVWQDLSQINARYGEKAGTIINNHRTKVFLSGIADVATLDLAAKLAGESDRITRSTTTDRSNRASSSTKSWTPRPLLGAHHLRRLPPGSGVCISGHLPPIRLLLRDFRHLSSGPGDGAARAEVRSTSRWR